MMPNDSPKVPKTFWENLFLTPKTFWEHVWNMSKTCVLSSRILSYNIIWYHMIWYHSRSRRVQDWNGTFEEFVTVKNDHQKTQIYKHAHVLYIFHIESLQDDMVSFKLCWIPFGTKIFKTCVLSIKFAVTPWAHSLAVVNSCQLRQILGTRWYPPGPLQPRAVWRTSS